MTDTTIFVNSLVFLVQQIYLFFFRVYAATGFRLQAGERKPLEGGLSAVSLLGLFNLSNACSFVFADRFVRLFWQHRTQDRGIEIGFEEFVRLLSIWTRGEAYVFMFYCLLFISVDVRQFRNSIYGFSVYGSGLRAKNERVKAEGFWVKSKSLGLG